MKYLRITLIVVISVLIGYFIGVNRISFAWDNYKPNLTIVNKEPPVTNQTLDLAKFWEVLDKLQSNYYDKSQLDAQKLLDGAIVGMVEGIGDPYTVYLPPVENTEFKEGLAGQFSGIGAELGMNEKQIIVVAPIDGSPAQKAGIRAGDAIYKVDDEMTSGWTLNQAVDKIRGPKGTDVTLTVLHKNEDKPSEIKITRDTITVKSVVGWVKPVKDIDELKGLKTNTKNIAYIRLSQFGDTANKDWVSVINQMQLDMKKLGNVSGFILDLRNNPGGYLTEAQFIAGEFLPEGKVVVTQDSGNGNTESLYVNRNGLVQDIPMVVLLNGGSASASEIVAGALRDHNRAQIVGEKSFGKGTIQSSEDLGAGAGLHITIAKWLTPNGTWVHKNGLEPDVAVEISEADLSHDTQLEKAVEVLVQ